MGTVMDHFIVKAVPPWAPEPRVFHVVAQNKREALDACYKRFPELLDVRENCGEEYEVEISVKKLRHLDETSCETVYEL